MSIMKDLINELVTIYKAGIVSGDTDIKTVFKGLQDDPEQVAHKQFPYLALDDGGERTEDSGSNTAQNRFFSVVMEVGCYSLKDEGAAMDLVFDRFDEVKTILESNIMKTMFVTTLDIDGFLWGVTVVPFGWEAESKFFRGRTMTVDFWTLENKRSNY